jgi:membrane protease YdiL (CAAX protease family)
MKTCIGSGFGHSRKRRLIAVAVGILIAGLDLAVFRWGLVDSPSECRGTLAVLAVAIYASLADGDARSLGLRLSPIQGWWYWVRAGLAIGFVIGLLVIIGWGAWRLSGRELPAYASHVDPPDRLVNRFLFMCVFTPVLEEAIYRFALCVPMAPFGPWKAILLSGFLFGLLHVVYGNPSPENLFGGFFIAWAFLKSESMLLPVLLHSLGNVVALGSQVATWYWQVA